MNFLNCLKIHYSYPVYYYIEAEGDKHQKEMVRFTNSDPAMIVALDAVVREGVQRCQNDKFRIALHIHNLHMADNVKDYWAKITDIPLNQFYKMYIKKSSLRYKGSILYNGTCKIIVNNKDLFRKIAGWKLGLLKNISKYPLLVVQWIEPETSNL